jgi:hypothetical protein
LVIIESADGIAVESVVVAGAENQRVGVSYALQCDADWRVRWVHISVIGEGREIELVSDGTGNWTDVAGCALPGLEGAVDIDLTITPFTNTLPIRRLNLKAGEKAEIDVAYVTFPDLTLTRERQIYTCVAPLERYRFETADGAFIRDIDVDDAGLVVTYPGLFQRVL